MRISAYTLLLIFALVLFYGYKTDPDKFGKWLNGAVQKIARGELVNTKITNEAKIALKQILGDGGPATSMVDDSRKDDSTSYSHEIRNMVVNVYSARKEELSRELFNRFEEKSGIKVNVITDEAGKLLSRAKSEGANSAMDVILTSDVLSLHNAAAMGILTTLPDSITTLVPDSMRDIDGKWVAITKRARIIVYAKDRVTPDSSLLTYKDLALPKWKAKLITRSSANPYNQFLIASMLYHYGTEEMRDWCKHIAENFARNPQGGDTDQIKAVAGGIADVALVNHYYYARLLYGNDDDRALAGKIGVIFPGQADFGTHINISGAGISEYSKNRKNAEELIKFLLSDEAQATYANKNNEYPVRHVGSMPKFLSDSMSYKFDESPLNKIADYYAEAERISMQEGWR